jgi:hypothetical protein
MDKISKRSIGFVTLSILLIMAVAAFAVDGNYQIIVRAMGLSDTNPMPSTQAKGTNIVLGQYSTTHQTNADTAVDMCKNEQGTINVTVNSGTGKWQIGVLSSTSTTGTFAPIYMQSAGTVAAFPLLSTSVNRTFHIGAFKDKAIKIVPTLASGTSNATFTFTPAN